MKPFECIVHTVDDWSVISVSGNISETSDFGGVSDDLRHRVRIDLSGVERINSTGVRQWIRFVEALSIGRTVELERCAVPFVQQLNMINNMAGGGRVVSLMLPFYCEACDEERSLFVADATIAPAEALAEQPCPSCGAEMEFDDVPENYFSFVRR